MVGLEKAEYKLLANFFSDLSKVVILGSFAALATNTPFYLKVFLFASQIASALLLLWFALVFSQKSKK